MLCDSYIRTWWESVGEGEEYLALATGYPMQYCGVQIMPSLCDVETLKQTDRVGGISYILR
jgi:hypothetical protein